MVHRYQERAKPSGFRLLFALQRGPTAVSQDSASFRTAISPNPSMGFGLSVHRRGAAGAAPDRAPPWHERQPCTLTKYSPYSTVIPTGGAGGRTSCGMVSAYS